MACAHFFARCGNHCAVTFVRARLDRLRGARRRYDRDKGEACRRARVGRTLFGRRPPVGLGAIPRWLHRGNPCDTPQLMMRLRAGLLAVVGLLLAAASTSTAAADDDEAVRPKINLFYRWLEDWSALADPRLRTQPLDRLKYIPLPSDDPKSYVSLGLTVRERFELNDAALFGISGNESNSYLLDRLQWHVDVRPNAHWQIFVEFEDVRAPAKAVITPADENPLDLRLAFITYVDSFWGGTLKARVGRQEMAFDLQRFVSVRDGPNLRQAYDAAWLDWEQREWRFIGFWSMPVQYRHEHFFDDFSSEHFQYGGVRAERKNVGPGDLSTSDTPARAAASTGTSKRWGRPVTSAARASAPGRSAVAAGTPSPASTGRRVWGSRSMQRQVITRPETTRSARSIRCFRTATTSPSRATRGT